MGALIHLIAPVQAVPDAARLYCAVGRSLSATDFAQQGRYIDARLLGLTPKNLGVISGLGVSASRYDNWPATVGPLVPGTGVTGGAPSVSVVRSGNLATSASPPNFTVAPGTGIGADGRLVRLTAPLSFTWQDLLQTMTPPNAIGDGVYLLILRTVEFEGVEAPPPDPSADAGGDPLLDIRQDSFVELSLSASIGPLPTTLTAAGAAFALNALIARLSQQSLESAIGSGVPIALVMTHGNQLLMLSQAAGRVAAAANQIEALLLAQTREALGLALNELGGAPTADAWATITWRFEFLPGACELPLSMLKAPAEVNPAGNPSCPFLPPGVAVYLQIVPSSQTTNLLTGALGRPPINLTNIDGPAVTLSLAVPDAIWAPNLLAEPYGDPLLPADLHFAYAQARAAQVALREDWIALYGGMTFYSGTTSVPPKFPQELAFLAGADGAAQDLSFLLTIGAISTQNLIDAATASSNPATFLPMITLWLSAVNLVNATSTQEAAAAAASASAAAYAATAPVFVSASPPPTSSALTAALTNPLPALASSAALTGAVSAAGASPASIAIAAGQAAALATIVPAPVSGSVNALIVNAVCAAMASAATALIAAAYPSTATSGAVLTAATAVAAPAALLNAQTAISLAPLLLANLGYQILPADTPEPLQADPSQSNFAPPSSDSLLTTLKPFLPEDCSFATWSKLLTATPPNATLLQTLINAGVVNANDSAKNQAAAIDALLDLPAAGDPANDDAQPGALLQLATTQLFYAVLGRIARAQEYVLDAHSRLIALQRQHLDMMSTYISAVAGGVPPDGSGLSITKIIPYINLTPLPPPSTPPSPPTPPQPVFTAPITGSVGRFTEAKATASLASLASAANTTKASGLARSSTNAVAADALTRKFANSSQVSAPLQNVADATEVSAAAAPATFASQVANAPVSARILSNPSISNLNTLFGSQTDIAKSVAAETSAVSQGPQFSYSPVSYGTAAHVTPGATLFQSAQTGLSGLRTLMGKSPISVAATALAPLAPSLSTADEATYYDGVMQITRCLLSDIAQVENNAIKIENGYSMMRDRLQSLEALISQLTGAVAAARDALRAAQAASAKYAGDYAAAQTLVAEEVARVTAAVQARNQAIAAATGLFMVRQLQTVVARNPPATLSLTADTLEDLAPGCLADHPGPPASLTPFLDLLLETPLANWTSLAGGWTGLPDNSGLQRLSGLRAARLVNFAPSTNFGGGAAASDLANLATSTRSVIDPVLRNTFSIGPSLALNQQAAFEVFSLPDLITLPANTLRTNAESLRASMESATGCLYQTLLALPPSARFAWATLARAGTLPTLSFMQWPLPDGPTAATTTALRQLSALVTWMARQLTDGASAAAQTALGNLVGAAVIASAYGDPNEAVSGAVVSTGGVPQPGSTIRITLNRPPPIDTVLNMFDANQNIVGTLRVQDHDAYGTSATVVTSFAKTAPSATWTVASQGGRSPWLAS